MTRTITNSLSMAGLLTLLLAAPGVSAFERYMDPVSGGGNCSTCHGDFTDDTSPKGSVFPLGNKHDMHRFTMGTDCDLCHTQGDDRNPFLGSSDGTAEVAGRGCVGCHGRDEDSGNDSVSNGVGAGLRQHHTNAGINGCMGCHTDANPAGYTPVGEDVAPFYYGSVDTMADMSCNPDAMANFNENWTTGDFIGLDNDGDLLVDASDPDCAQGQPPMVFFSLVLSDLDNSGADEAAIAASNNDAGQVIIKDSESGDAVATVDASAGLSASDVEVISDLNGNGSDDIAFLLLASTDSQPKVEVRDPLTNARIKNVDYNKQHEPVALAIMADQNGNQTEEGLVLAKQLNQNDRPRLLIRDLSTKAKVNNVSLPKIFDPIDVVVGPDLNGNGADDAYVLSTRISDGKGFVNVWDTGGAGKIVNVQLPKQTDMLALDALVSAGGANAVTVLGLRTSDNVGRVFVYDAFTAAKIWAASQAPGRVPVDIKAYTDSGGNWRVAALQLRTSDQRPIVTIYNGNTGAVVTNVFYDAGEPLALAIYPDVSTSGNNEPELGVLFETTLVLRDSVTRDVVSVIIRP